MRRLPVLALLIGVLSLISCHNNSSTTSSTAITCTTTTASTSTTNGTTSTTSSTASTSSCNDPTTGITISISPATVSVNVATSTQFQAGLGGGTNTIVNWEVNNIKGGNDTLGRIDSNGLYHAPATIPTGATVTVSAVSFEDQNLSASSTVTILAPPAVTITPTSLTIASGTANTTTFTSTVTGAPTTNVNWLVNNTLGGNSTFGTISATGVYTAPLTPPPGSTVTVTAASADFPQSTANSTVTIAGYSKSSFKGQFAFSLAGKNASGPFFRAGSFQADGNGFLNGGLEDVNSATCAASNPISFVGSYSIASDGRGTLTFADGCTPATYSFVLVSNSQLQITGFDGTGTATGQAQLQDATFFNAAGLIGTYVFDFSGAHGGAPLSQIGEFTSDGAGNIASGLFDIDDGGAISSQVPFTGSYVVNSNGRGTATLGTRHYSFYIVSRGLAKFVGTDSLAAVGAVAGGTIQQTPGVVFDSTYLNNGTAFLLSGPVPNGAIATAGSFSADGNGNITSGALDENVNGAVTANAPISTGTYAISATTGRGTATIQAASHTYNLVFYVTTQGNAIVQETDSGRTSDGSFFQQQTTAFSQASIKGSYGLQSAGLSAGASQTISGQLSASGTGVISTGAIDINTAGTLTPAEAVGGTYTAPSANGRATLTLNPTADNRNFAVYIVNANQSIVLGIDSGRLAAGMLGRRF